jgi:hypothetical protein
MANIELDGANKKIKVDSGDLTLDVPGDIILDADGADLVFADGGTNILKVTNSSSDVVFQPQVDAKDIIFKQYDGTTVATVEDNGTFNIPTDKLAINGTAVTATAAELNLIDGGTARGTTAIADGDGVLINDAGTMRQTTVETLKTYIGGADPSSADGDSLGTASLEWSDLYLADGGIIYFGNDQDVTLTHDPDDGLFLKSIATADNNPVLLTLQTGETDMAADDVIGKIAFQAPDEGTGTDAILVSGAIQAVAEGDHSSSSNATRLEFMTGASEAATAKMSISSGGIVGMGAVPTGDLGEGLHIKTSDTGGGAANNSKELVIESNHASGGGMTITSKNDATGRIQFGDGDANSRFEVSYNHSTDKFQLSTAAAVAVAIDQAGIVSKPLQPASLYTAGDYDNLTGDGTTGDLGQTAGWGLTERWDNNADSVDGIFTAPVTGTYIIAGQVWLDDIASNHNELLIQMTTSNRTYYVAMDPSELPRSSGNSIGIPICAMADMDANDTHVLKIGVGGGSKVVDLISLTSVGIALIC